ncbi:hypothetical protein GGX14DRAFT_392429 [Mycena pura]|uniref:Uncharacterized protein n=1 Tax=Mycena pura TaxID=153505 RepID=A0AAD6VJ32_9AGAR|nr:hypothetical protein GGX14DRAFT_392429 [Mycena pura]
MPCPFCDLLTAMAVQLSHFRSIRVGDIDLISFVGEDNIVEHRVVRRWNRDRRVRVITGRREIYHAQIVGNHRTFTVFNHPQLVQLFGITQSPKMSALIYHDGYYPNLSSELVPVPQALANCKSYLHQRMLTCAMAEQYNSALYYVLGSVGVWMHNLSAEYTDWFRTSTGQLCIELGQDSKSYTFLLVDATNQKSHELNHLSLLLNTDLAAKDSLATMQASDLLDTLCSAPQSFGNPWSPISQALSFPPPIHPNPVQTYTWLHWDGERYTPFHGAAMTSTGWTQIQLSRLHNSKSSRDECKVHHFYQEVVFKYVLEMAKCWLAQANHWIPAGDFLPTAIRFWVHIWDPVDQSTLRGTFMANAPTPPKRRQAPASWQLQLGSANSPAVTSQYPGGCQLFFPRREYSWLPTWQPDASHLT